MNGIAYYLKVNRLSLTLSDVELVVEVQLPDACRPEQALVATP